MLLHNYSMVYMFFSYYMINGSAPWISLFSLNFFFKVTYTHLNLRHFPKITIVVVVVVVAVAD